MAIPEDNGEAENMKLPDSASEHVQDFPRAKQYIVFSVLILLLNVSILLILFTSKMLKKIFKFHVLTSITLVNVISSLVFFPRNIHLILQNTSHIPPDSTLAALFDAADLFVFPSISFLSISAIAADYILNRGLTSNVKSKLLASILGIAVPWMYGLTAFLPCLYQPIVFLNQKNHYSDSNLAGEVIQPKLGDYATTMVDDLRFNASNRIINRQTGNQLRYPSPVSIYSFVGLILIWLVLPLVMIIILTACASILSRAASASAILMRNHGNSAIFTAMPVDEIMEETLRPRYILDVILMSVLVVGFYAPSVYDLVSLALCNDHVQHGYYCIFPRYPRHKWVLLRWSLHFILPAIWMLDGRFRDASAKACGKLFVKSCVVY